MIGWRRRRTDGGRTRQVSAVVSTSHVGPLKSRDDWRDDGRRAMVNFVLVLRRLVVAAHLVRPATFDSWKH